MESVEIQKTLKDVQSSVADMNGQMKEMYTAIVGDRKFGHVGLVQRVEKLEDTKKKWEGKVLWLYGYVVGAGTLVTIIFEIIKSRL